ncbi:MAG: hypothetical protein GQ573_00565 [Gammaproteobacteria bacterium]|nr:hypothetical protein [Gammaproteobacteria bacterium]
MSCIANILTDISHLGSYTAIVIIHNNEKWSAILQSRKKKTWHDNQVSFLYGGP